MVKLQDIKINFNKFLVINYLIKIIVIGYIIKTNLS